MRKMTLALFAAILAGCGQPQSYAEDGERVVATEILKSGDVTYGISVVRDEKRGVTCYVFRGYRSGGIDCIPDAPPSR